MVRQWQTQTYNADLIITNGQVLTINLKMLDVIEDGVVVVKTTRSSRWVRELDYSIPS
ncbi:hypothetical protein OK016_29395 [Vibrio chagasii]|nr:hypothetical protein [Vibrio chagasii]